MKIKSILLAIGLPIIICCQSSLKNDNLDRDSLSKTNLDEIPKSNSIFGIEGEEIVIRKGPGNEFDKLVNQKATEILHKTQYASVDYTCKVEAIEEKNGWTKIIVVEPNWLSESHQGWIETKYILKNKNQDSEILAPRKINIFNSVSQVQTKLSSLEIGVLRRWFNDGYGWTSSTSYYSFGSISDENGMQNNLALYLDSKSEHFIETLQLVLNINNKSEKSKALSLLDKTTQKTFSVLNLKIPEGLSSAINSGTNFSFSQSDYKVSLILDKSRIDTWKLIIVAK